MSSPDQRPARPTITDVARAAGVSTAVVSYAVNDRPGVSAATRDRVLRVAAEFGWRPSAAARSVRGGSRAVGLVVTDRPGAIARDAAFLDLVATAREVLEPHGLTLGVHFADPDDGSSRSWRAWWEERRFDVLGVPDLLSDDPHVTALSRAGAPVVVLGPAPGPETPTQVWFDEGAIADGVVSTMVGLGHRLLALVTGPVRLHRTAVRLEAFRRAARQHDVTVVHRESDGTVEGAAAAAHTLLTTADRPSVVVHDGPTPALAGLDVARRCGLRVPWDVSVIAIGDSPLCRLAAPPVTVVPLPVRELGYAFGRAVLDVHSGTAPGAVVVPVTAPILRGSTGPFGTAT